MQKTESNVDNAKNQNQTPQYVQHSNPLEDDSIDLYELWITLWSKRWFVIGVTIVAALGSVFISLRKPHIYKAETLILPPKAEDIQLLNLVTPQRNELTRVNAENVFASFKDNLRSRKIQKKFIEKYGLMELLAPSRAPEIRDEDIYEGFSQLIKIGNNSISIELNDPVVAAKWVNNFVEFVDIETIALLVGNIKKLYLSRIRDIKYTINSKRKMAKQRRQDSILTLENARSIATELGVEDRIDTINVIQNNQLTVKNGGSPLYFRGAKALKAEIRNLYNRNSDDPYIKGLRDLQEELTLLDSIVINSTGLNSVTIDRAAYPPRSSIKPNRRLIVSIGTVIGLFLGIFLVFFASFVQKQKELHYK